MSTTTNMVLTLPDVSSTVGPTWASLLNAALTTIDAHDHSSGKGVRITPSGLNISSDLTFAQNNATNLRSCRLYNNSAFTVGVNDRTCLYALNGELYYEDGSGNAVQITSGGTLNVSVSITSLTLKDSSFTLQYYGDTTKQMRFDASAITTGTTRIYTLPDVTDTITTLTAAQTLTNKTLDSTSTATGIKIASFTPNGSNTITVPAVTDTLVTLAASQTLTNKVLSGNTIATLTPDGTHTVTMPAATDTLVGKTTTDTLTNKTLTAPVITAIAASGTGTITTGTTIVDTSDATKVFGWTLSGATTSTKTTIAASQTTNRTITLPDATDTLVGKATTDDLTNKSFNGTTVVKAANELRFNNSGNTFYTSLKAGANSANFAITLPIADGSSSQVLKTDGSGNLGWASASTYSRGDVATSATIAALSSSNSFTRLTGSTATTLQGITAGAAGAILTVYNQSSALVSITHQNGSASAANRIITPSALTVDLQPQWTAMFGYDDSQSRWILLHTSSAQEWKAYTPTYGAGFGTVTNNSAYYKILGDSLICRGSCTTGTVAASAGTISIPSGFTIASSKLSLSNSGVGTQGCILGNYGSSQISTNPGYILSATGSDTAAVWISTVFTSGSGSINTANGSSSLASSTTFSFQFEVPIV